MNIPQDTLQQVADAAFLSSNGGMMGLLTCNKEKNHVFWHEERYERRAVIQHAISNPALAPFLGGAIGEYTDEEIKGAGMDTFATCGIVINSTWLRAFLAALPRRESPALAEAITRAEKAEAELAKSREINQGFTKSCLEWEKIVQELKSSQLGILRPIAEMSPTVPEGCTMVFGSSDSNGVWDISDILSSAVDTHFAILRLPAAEPTPPAKAEQLPAMADPLTLIGGVPFDQSSQVPLALEDVKPKSALRSAEGHWFVAAYATTEGVAVSMQLETRFIVWENLMNEGWQINTSIPDTGRLDANAWRPCSKPAGKEVESEHT